MSIEAISLTALFAHKGKIGPEGAITFGWMMLTLAGLLAAVLIIARISSGQRPYLGGLFVAVPFGLLACWCFGFAAACQQGVDPNSIRWVVVVGFPVSLGVLIKLYRWWSGRAEESGASERDNR
jgi:hypothetical protein